jgi:hypothetical protein
MTDANTALIVLFCRLCTTGSGKRIFCQTGVLNPMHWKRHNGTAQTDSLLHEQAGARRCTFILRILQPGLRDRIVVRAACTVSVCQPSKALVCSKQSLTDVAYLPAMHILTLLHAACAANGTYDASTGKRSCFAGGFTAIAPIASGGALPAMNHLDTAPLCACCAGVLEAARMIA